MHKTQPHSHAAELQKSSNKVTMNPVFSIRQQNQPVISRRKTVGDRPGRFECSNCGKAFSRSEHLKRHERAHNKERPFSCMYCKRAFVRKDILSRHVKSFHPGMEGSDSIGSEATAQTTVTNQSPTQDFFGAYLMGTDDIPEGPASNTTGSPASYGDSLLPTGVGSTQLADGTDHGASQNPSIQSPQSQNYLEVLSHSPDEHTIPRGPTTIAVQRRLPLTSSVDTNAHQTTSSDDAGSFWTTGNWLLSDGHFPCDTGSGSPAILGDTFYDEHAIGDTYTSLSSPSKFLQSLAFQSTNDNTVTLQPGTLLLPPVPTRVDQSLYTASAQIFSAPGDGDSNQSASTAANKQAISWINDDLEQEMQYAEKLHTLYPSICFDTDALPTTNAFLRYIDFYFKYCSPQLPFLHQPSFDLWTNFPALILSVTSVGAIYSAEHETAFSLHCISKRILKQFEEETAFSTSKTPLGYVQAEFLNMLFAAWSGDARGVKYGSSLQSSVVTKVKLLLKDAEKEVIWNIKLERFPDTLHRYEEVKRLFYAVYIASVVFSSSAGDNPSLFNHDCSSIRLPCQEDEWTRRQPDRHGALFTASIAPLTFDQALSILSKGQNDDFGPFQLRILIAAIYLEFWQASCLSRAGVDDSASAWKEKIKRMLQAWYACFQSGSERRRAACISEYERPMSEPPLTFDALALYRHIQVELVIPLRVFSQQLRDHESEPEVIAGALWDLRDEVHRSPEMTEAIVYCLETLRIPLSRGTAFIARTGPLYWSVEHVPLGSILCVILCLWTSRFNDPDAPPADEIEEINLQRLRDMLRDAGHRPQKQDLPSVVAEIWGTMLNSSCYVWKVTPEYAKVFKSCACTFAANRAISFADGG